MSRGLFVTGTDTGCGKTHVAAVLIRALRARGVRVAPFKPVAAGADLRDGELRNDDALALIAASGRDLPYRRVNPYCFAPAIAPHLAAAARGQSIELPRIVSEFNTLSASGDFVVVEGAGGWLVPLGGGASVATLAAALRLPVLLVVGLRLGCINHALLTERAMRAGGVAPIGWIGSQVDPNMAELDANVETLVQHLSAPCLGVLGHPGAAAPPHPPRPLRIEPLLTPDAKH